MIIRAPLSSAGPRLSSAISRSMTAASVAGVQSGGEQAFGALVESTRRLTGELQSSIKPSAGFSIAESSAPPGATSNLAEYRSASRGLRPGQSMFITADAGFASLVQGVAIFPEESVRAINRRRLAQDAVAEAERAWR